MTRAETFEALPEPVQQQLLRIGRVVSEMTPAELDQARLLLASFGLAAHAVAPEEAVAALEIVAACSTMVRLAGARKAADGVG